MTSGLTLDPIHTDPIQGRIFRALLEATAHPGRVVEFASMLAGRPALAGVLAALADQATTLADPAELLDRRDRTLIPARPAAVGEAMFVAAPGHQAPPDGFVCRLGGAESPETGATLLLTVATLDAGPESPDHAQTPDDAVWQLTGPGIAGRTDLRITGLHPQWRAWRDQACARFPLGVDLLLVTATAVAVLPRHTRIF